MKKNLLVFAFLLLSFSAFAQTVSPIKMHRIQDTTKNSSGLYYGKSTEGKFSVLLPIPFNDFSYKSEEVATFCIGSKSLEGIKFSVTEVTKKDKSKQIVLDDFLKVYDATEKVENVKKERGKNSESTSFSVIDKTKGAIVKYIIFQNCLFAFVGHFSKLNTLYPHEIAEARSL